MTYVTIHREICRSSNDLCMDVEKFIGSLAQAYQRICQAKKPEGRDLTEFFGLRDFYRPARFLQVFAPTSLRDNYVLKHEKVNLALKKDERSFL